MPPKKRKEDDSNWVEFLKEKAEAATDYAGDKAEKAKDYTQDFITENPWKSIAVAAAVGALVAVGINALIPKKKSLWDRLF
jgi:ElaB/YqjD/DUF883 family membrane-anchored ribosome-binding protein